ncbi:tetratricopeptide repeat protein, partial [Gilliamella sp. B3976]
MKKILFVVLTALLSTTAYANNCITYLKQAALDKALVACNTEAEQGDKDAQYNLALMYDEGEGVKESKEKAIYWYTKAAEQGVGDAQYNLAVIYDEGEGVEESKEKAIYWYTKAAE